MIKLNDYWLRAVEGSDLSWMKDLRNDESTWSNLGHFTFLNDAKQQKWFENINARDDVEYLIFGHKKDNLGIVRITDIDWVNRSMCVGGDILPEHRGKGHAKHKYELIFKLGFNIWGMHRLWLLVLATNKVAIHVYEKMGFVEEGKQRKAIYKNGEFVDYIMMSILDQEYYKKTSKNPDDK